MARAKKPPPAGSWLAPMIPIALGLKSESKSIFCSSLRKRSRLFVLNLKYTKDN
ncbi:MAG: hypothetical protein ACFFA8_00245 [Promethearchaeota archaeon]